MTLDPDRALPGKLAMLAPHMDDELIGCGGILATLADPSRAHVVYVSDGSGSPAPSRPWQRVDRKELARIRRREAQAGLEELGLPEGNAHFLELPDGGLSGMGERLDDRISTALTAIGPGTVLVPFRMDRHPDHLAVYRAVRRLVTGGVVDGRLLEYFVYSRWKLLPGGDIRKRVRPELLLAFQPGEEARTRKRRALERHRSQISRFFDWQARPALTSDFLDGVTIGPEHLLEAPPEADDRSVFQGPTFWIRAVHTIEPGLKRAKDRFFSLVGA